MEVKRYQNIVEKFLIIFLPISIIIGNFFLNFTISCIIFISILSFINNKIKLIKNLKLILIFTAIVLLYNYFNSINKNLSLIGIIGIVKHILFFISFLYLFQKNIKNFDYFIISSLVVVLFVGIDSYIQFFNGSDIFGFKVQTSHGYRLSGPFGDEYVVGSFISKFFFISLLYFNKIKIMKNLKLFSYFAFTIIIVFLSSERASFILLIIAVSVFLLNYESIKKIRFYILIFIVSITTVFISFNDKAKEKHLMQYLYYANLQNVPIIENYLNNYCYMKNPNLSEIKENNPSNCLQKYGYTGVKQISFKDSRHGAHFLTAIEIFKSKPIIGSGIKTFRIKCKEKSYDYIDSKSKNQRCSTHPHQLYLEILAESGLLVFAMFVSIIIFLLVRIFKSKNLSNYTKSIMICLMIVLFFPIQTSGSFFSTFNGIFYWLSLIVLFHVLKIKIIEQKY